MTSALLLAAVVAAIVALPAPQAIRRLSGGVDHIGVAPVAAAAFIGALILLLASPAEPWSERWLTAGCAGAVMMALAVTDWKTAWAPDYLTFALASLAGIWVFATGDSPLRFLFALIAGQILFGVVQVFYLVLNRKIPSLPPPPDILAFAVGPAFLGFTLPLAVALTLSALILIFFRLRPHQPECERAEVMARAAEDLGYDPAMGPAFPLLPALLPVILLAFCVSLVMPDIGL